MKYVNFKKWLLIFIGSIGLVSLLVLPEHARSMSLNNQDMLPCTLKRGDVLTYVDRTFGTLIPDTGERQVCISLVDSSFWEDAFLANFWGESFSIDEEGNLYVYVVRESLHRYEYDVTRVVAEINLSTGEQRIVLNISNPIMDHSVSPGGDFLEIGFLPLDQLPFNRRSDPAICMVDLHNVEQGCREVEYGFVPWRLWLNDQSYIVGIWVIVDIETLTIEPLLPEMYVSAWALLPEDYSALAVGQLHEPDWTRSPTYDVFLVDLGTLEITELPYDIDSYAVIYDIQLSPDKKYFLSSRISGGESVGAIHDFETGEQLYTLEAGIPIWTPDSQYILYRGVDTSTKGQSLIRFHIETGETTVLYESAGHVWVGIIP